MIRFYNRLWFSWFIRVSLESVFFASIFSLIITFFLYLKKDMPQIDSEVLKALYTIFLFWFGIVWSVTLLLALFRSIKYIFNRCYYGINFKLTSCDTKVYLEEIGYGDLVRVWRRWIMLLIWGVLFLSIVATIILKLVYNLDFFKWFNIYILYLFIIISGYFSFIFLPFRCQKVKVSRC
jgi:hypothetical protein